MMSKSIIITESQYRRLMLVEQTYNAKKNPEQKDGRYYTYTPQEKEFESLMSDIQVWKMQKSQGLAGSNQYCKDPCSTTVTGTIKGDIDKGVICVNYNLLHNDGYICKEGYGMRSLVAKEYGTLDHNTIREMTKKLPTIKGATLVDFVKKNRHEIIDVLSVATFFIPIVGPFISVGLEGVNSAMYLVEGDHLGAGLSAIFMLIPIGGPLLRRATMPAIKKTAKFMDYVADIEKRSQLNEFEKKRLINESWEKLGKTEQKLVQELKQPDNVAKLNDFKRLGEGGVKKYLKKNKDTYKKILKVETSIGKGSRFWDEFKNPTKLEKGIYAGSVSVDYVVVPMIEKYFQSEEGIPQSDKEKYAQYFQNNLISIMEELDGEETDKFVEIITPLYVNTLKLSDELGFDDNQKSEVMKITSKNAPTFQQEVNGKNRILKSINGDVSQIYPDYNLKAKKLVTTKSGQQEITNNGEDITYDNTWDYKLYKGAYFTRKKGENQWSFIDSTEGVSKLDKKIADDYVDGVGELETTDQAYQAFLLDLLQ